MSAEKRTLFTEAEAEAREKRERRAADVAAEVLAILNRSDGICPSGVEWCTEDDGTLTIGVDFEAGMWEGD